MGNHDEEVLRQARMYHSDGYKVEADIDGWTKPEIINRHRPDVIAWRAGPWPERIIVEVETSLSVDSDHTKSQVEAFERAAGEDSITEFRLVVI